jgi:hypothetical protein
LNNWSVIASPLSRSRVYDASVQTVLASHLGELYEVR